MPSFIIHAAWFRPDEIHRFTRIARKLQQNLVAPDKPCGPVGKAGGQKAGPVSRVETFVVLLQNAGLDQRLAQPVDCLLWPAKPCVQLGRRWRCAAFRQNFENADGT